VIDGGVAGASTVEHHAMWMELEWNADVSLSEVGLISASNWCNTISWTWCACGGWCGCGSLSCGGWKWFAMATSFTVVNKLHSLVSTIVFTNVTRSITSHLRFTGWHRLTLAFVTGTFLDLGSDRILGSVVHTSVTFLRKSNADFSVEFL